MTALKGHDSQPPGSKGAFQRLHWLSKRSANRAGVRTAHLLGAEALLGVLNSPRILTSCEADVGPVEAGSTGQTAGGGLAVGGAHTVGGAHSGRGTHGGRGPLQG